MCVLLIINLLHFQFFLIFHQIEHEWNEKSYLEKGFNIKIRVKFIMNLHIEFICQGVDVGMDVGVDIDIPVNHTGCLTH